ncbi:MAG TPA: biopolymer transporter ExbD [Saprospiraceae bacterium]|jgi:biopolymer transport protein ExbD
MEIQNQNRKSVSTKVDLTAMVDLGFLLITFFMLASTLAQPHIMQVIMPDGKGDPTPYPQSKTATIILGSRDRIYTYSLPDELTLPDGIFIDSMDYSPAGLRDFIQRRQLEVKSRWGDQDKLMVIIKPLAASSFKNIVDVLDEMQITNVKRYAIVRPDSPLDSMVLFLSGQK